MLDQRTSHATALFTGVAWNYESPAELLSFGQYARWRRALVRALPIERSSRVLDVATGTGLIARLLSERSDHVAGVDLTPAMLRGGSNAAADARALPFAGATFDVVTFSYLLRYVDEPAAQLRELARVVKPGGWLGSVEFFLPRAAWARAGWNLYARGVFPFACRLFGKGWAEIGDFLPRSIVQWARAWPVDRQLEAWRAAGVEPVTVKPMTFGGTGLVITGRKR
ncbi:MAG: class I SAM-dependent methyltransferase [Actinomycetota bacterium]